MADVKARNVATGALVLAGGAAAFVAAWLGGQSPSPTPDATQPPVSAGVPADEPDLLEKAVSPDAEALQADADIGNSFASTPLGSGAALQAMDQRKLPMSGDASAIRAARENTRVGDFKTDRQLVAKLQASSPKLGLDNAASRELRRDVLQAQSVNSETGPIEFLVKMKDRKLIDEMRALYAKSPEDAERRIKDVLGDGKLVERAHLQGFTLGGEAILSWDGPGKVMDYARAHDEIQRTLNAAPGVSYAEQNYTADIKSAH